MGFRERQEEQDSLWLSIEDSTTGTAIESLRTQWRGRCPALTLARG